MSDPYYNNVSLLLHGNGTNGSTTFTDNSPSPKTLTAFGNAQISTAQSKFGGASMRFDGSGDSLTTPDHAAFEFGAGNFTIEAWVRPGAYATNNNGEYQSTIVCQDTFGQRAFAFNIRGTATSWTELVFLGFSSPTVYTLVTASVSLSNSTWYHLAVVRSGNFIYFFVDGVLINAGGSAFSETIQQDITSVLRIGANEFDATYRYYFNGYIDDLRITKGVARYTANFTPPTAAFDDFYSSTINADVAAIAAATGDLTTGIQLAGTVVSEATAAGSLQTVHELAGSAAAIAAATGDLSVQIRFSGAALAEAIAAASLDNGINLAGNAAAQAAGIGALTTSTPISADAVAVVTVAGALTSPINLEGAAISVANVAGELTVEIRLSGAAAAQVAAAGLLTTGVNLSGAAIAQALARGTLVSISIIRAGQWTLQSVTPVRRFSSFTSAMPRRILH